jgi:hypothetical protein
MVYPISPLVVAVVVARKVVDVMMIAYSHLHFGLKRKMEVLNLALMILRLIVVGFARLMGFLMRAVVLRMR